MSRDENDLYQRIQEVLIQSPENRHSYFQMQYFVIGKEPTVQAQMWQCLREMQSRKATIDSLKLSIEETKDQLDLVEIENGKYLHDFSSDYANNYPEELKDREHIIKCRQFERKKQMLQLSLDQLEESLQFAWQEIKFFLKMFEALRKIEPLKDYDDLDAQKEYWNERIAQQINIKLLLQQPLDIELVQTALSLNEDAPVRLQMQKILEQVQLQMDQLKKTGDESNKCQKIE